MAIFEKKNWTIAATRQHPPGEQYSKVMLLGRRHGHHVRQLIDMERRREANSHRSGPIQAIDHELQYHEESRGSAHQELMISDRNGRSEPGKVNYFKSSAYRYKHGVGRVYASKPPDAYNRGSLAGWPAERQNQESLNAVKVIRVSQTA